MTKSSATRNAIIVGVENVEELEALKGAEVETPSLFANVDFTNPEIWAIHQPVKLALDILSGVVPKEIEQKEKQRKERGSSELKFEKDKRGIKVVPDRGWGLTPTSQQGQEIRSNLQNIIKAGFYYSVGALFYYAEKHGSFRINAKLTDIIRNTGAYTGKRINPERIKSLSDYCILANRIDLKPKVPEYYSYPDKQGRRIYKKVGKYEALGKYTRLFRIGLALWATDKQGNYTYIKRIIDGEILPDIKNKNQLRGDIFNEGYFKLSPENEAERLKLAWYLLGRFSQKTAPTKAGEPIKADRGFLIKQAGFEATDKANKSEGSVKLKEALNRLKELEIIDEWFVLKDKSKKIPTDDNTKIAIYPAKTIIASLLAKPKKEAEPKPSDYLVKLKKFRNNNGLSETAKWLGCGSGDIEKMISGELKPTGEQLERVLNN
jgi:hypothetical protein